ncbi:hypothetical protein D3C86_1690860 [compost metagenome]
MAVMNARFEGIQPGRKASVKTMRCGLRISRNTAWLGYSLPSGSHMTVRKTPPTLSSISQIGVVMPCGPHHWARSSGSVQARNTLVRGASIKRLMDSSYSAGLALTSGRFILLFSMPQGLSCLTGRTSTLPTRAAGILPATCKASLRSRASMR